jgi:hypothetical protein
MFQDWVIDGHECAEISRMKEWQGEQKYLEKTCPVTL